MTTRSELITIIKSARPVNEAEVETKIVLHIFQLLGYSDKDRADKKPVKMRFGRETTTKVADFAVYYGEGRDFEDALILQRYRPLKNSLRSFFARPVGQ